LIKISNSIWESDLGFIIKEIYPVSKGKRAYGVVNE
jgi:hypothetical protein